MLRCGPAVFHRSARRRCGHTAIYRLIPGNAIPRLACVRHRRPRTGSLSIQIEVRSRARVHTPWQLSRNAIESRHSRIAEIQLSHACGTSETPECSSGIETIYGTQTIFGIQTICGTETISEMETTNCAVTGKTTFSLRPRGIGIATGTATATSSGMATDA